MSLEELLADARVQSFSYSTCDEKGRPIMFHYNAHVIVGESDHVFLSAKTRDVIIEKLNNTLRRADAGDYNG